MREKAYLYFMHIHVLFSLSLVLLWFSTTTATSHGHQLVAAAEGKANYKCIVKERQALLDFKSQLQDPNDMLSTWRPEEEDDCCQWSGITCDTQTGHVTSLDLIVNALGGEISHSLLNLTYLNYLDLSGNSFHGTTLEFIGPMTHLAYLDLGNNHFTGTIPDIICNMTNLTFLNLGANEFSGIIPKSIGSLTKLTGLYLNENNFSGIIPKSIGSLTKLTGLDLRGNNFTGTIPRTIGSLTKLKYLHLSDNSLYGTIPPEFGNLTNLKSLSLENLRSCTVENLDWLSSLSCLRILELDGTSLAKGYNWVNVIISLQNLEELSLRGCDLSLVMHPYSSSVNSSSSIDTLYLDNNNLNSSMYRWLCPLIGNRLSLFILSGNTFDGKLSGFLNKLSGCISATLQALDASNNQFTGSLSDEIQSFSSLQHLNLSSNKLDGTISDKLWQLPDLQELDLSSNSLIRGVVSESIGKSNLLYIDFSKNSLEGFHFNADMSNLSKSVEYVDLSSCKLGTRFPKWILKMKNLLHLDLSSNNISDTIPTEYWNQWSPSRLQYLDLSRNNISGTLPESFPCPKLVSIDLSFNKFDGPIPVFPAGLRFLDLSKNKFSEGMFFLCQRFEQLAFLDVSNNSLTGQLPDCLCSLTRLKVLILRHNILSGRLPPSIGCLVQLETLSLYNNSFSGELPSSFKNCTKLRLLDLGANKFIGNVPVWVGEKFSRLYVLTLRSNNFFGTFPLELCQLVNLQILDLSINNLNGTIPECVKNFTTMAQRGFFLKQNVHHFPLPYPSSEWWTVNANSFDNSYIDHLMIEWQGKVNEFSSTLGLVKTIDLSSNNLTGQIPYEFTYLQGLVVLDLSRNALVGEIPQDIGLMKELLTLNLSRNMFSGEIPSTMSQMDRLNDLDLSYNNLSGRIPSSTQLQSFPPQRFAGNAGLCGLPTTKKCLGDVDLGDPPVGESEGDAESTDELQRWFYIGGATGIATAFWIACIALLLNRRLRHAFFRFQNCLKDWVYVKVVVLIARLRRVARA